MHTNSDAQVAYMMLTSPATVILTLKVQIVKSFQLILNNYTVKTDLDKLSYFYYFFFHMHCYGSCQHLYLFAGRCMRLVVRLTSPSLLAHLKLFFCVSQQFTYLHFLYWPTNSMLYRNFIMFVMFCTCWVLVFSFLYYP